MHIDHMSANPKAILIATILSTHRFCGARTHRERPAAPAWLALATLATVFSLGCSGSGASSGAGPHSVTSRAALAAAPTAFHHALRTTATATFLS
jgi:hypothetical protein